MLLHYNNQVITPCSPETHPLQGDWILQSMTCVLSSWYFFYAVQNNRFNKNALEAYDVLGTNPGDVTYISSLYHFFSQSSYYPHIMDEKTEAQQY